jgi:hypothetical protein
VVRLIGYNSVVDEVILQGMGDAAVGHTKGKPPVSHGGTFGANPLCR